VFQSCRRDPRLMDKDQSRLWGKTKQNKKTSTPPTMDMVILYKEHEQNKICLGN